MRTLYRLRRILRIAIPVILQSLLDLLAMTVSFLFIGELGSEVIAALGAAVTFFMYLFVFSNILNVGTTAIVARKVGAKDWQSASRLLSSMLLATAVLSIPLSVLMFWGRDLFLLLFSLNERALSLASQYLYIVLWSLPFFLFKIVIAAAMTANNDAITPFRIKTLAVGMHVILNSLLIAGNLGFPALGLMGAAVANLVVNILESLLIFAALWRSKKRLHLCWCFERNLTLQAFKIGIPSGLERFSTFSSMTIISSFIAGYGESVFAGYLIGGRIEAFVFMPAFGFMVAAMSLMGQNLGAHKVYEAKRSTYLTLVLAMSFMGLLGIVLILFPITISRPFSLDDSVLQSASLYLFYIGFSQVFFAMNMVLDGALRGAGATKITLLVNALSIWILRIVPASLIILWQGDVWLIYLLMSVETMLRALVFWTLFQKGVWHRESLY